MPTTLLSDLVVMATEVHRHAGQILHKAIRRPVTVKTKGADLVILRRELVWKLLQGDAHLRKLEELMTYYLERCIDKRRDPGPTSLRWMDVFDDDDVLDFLKEYIRALNSAIEGPSDWSVVDDVIYEWRESAVALNDQELQESARMLKERLEIGRTRAPTTS